MRVRARVLEREHLMSAWVRYNYLRGFANHPFSYCRKYWGLNNVHIKPQRVFASEQIIFLLKLTSDGRQQRQLMMDHTIQGQWSLSKKGPITEQDEFEPANLEQRAFAFPMSWKLCPTCCAEDQNKLGHSYWHRNHQLAAVTQCDIHGTPLLTSTSLRTFDRLILPHTISSDDVKTLNSASNSEALHEWNCFVFTLDELVKSNMDLINQWKHRIYQLTGIPKRVQQKHRLSVLERSREIESELGTPLMTHIFRGYGKKQAKEPRILHRLFPSVPSRYSIVHPIYWTSLFYWAYLKSELKGFVIYEYPSPT